MYKNRISRTPPNRHPQFFIRRSDIAFDERVAYVESVCWALVESRFGPGRISPVIVNLSDRPKLAPAPLYDLCDEEPNGLVPCYSLSPLSSLRRRSDYQAVEAAYRRAKQMESVAVASHGSSLTSGYLSNLGRGSP